MAAPAPFVFSLTPATSAPELALNMQTKEGQNVHKKVTEPFQEKFDGDEDNELAFVANVVERINSSGWDQTNASMFEIPIGAPYVTDVIDCIAEYGRVTLADIRAHALTYVNTQTRVAQNAYHMYEAIMASITPELHKRILVDIDDAKITGTGNGPLLFKLIMSECTIDTPATIMRLRGNIFHLDSYMTQAQGDIEKFNKYVKGTLMALKARGQQVNNTDLMIQLFKGYEANPDKKLSEYILRKKDAYEEFQVITPKELMEFMSNKYLTLVEEGSFKKPSEMEQKIVALSAKVNQQAQELKDKRLTLSKNLLEKIEGRRAGKSQGSGQGGGRKSKPEFKDGYRVYTGTHAWKMEPPKDGEPTTKQWKGRDYNWCPNHKAWVQHDPTQCDFDPKKRKFDGGKSQDKSKRRNDGENNEEVASIMQAIMNEIDAEE